MSFRRLTTLDDDVNFEVQAMTHKLFSSVPLPTMVDRLGGVQWIDSTVAVLLRQMRLETKLALITQGYFAISALIERLTHLWLSHSSGTERQVLEKTLIQAGLMEHGRVFKDT